MGLFTRRGVNSGEDHGDNGAAQFSGVFAQRSCQGRCGVCGVCGAGIAGAAGFGNRRRCSRKAGAGAGEGEGEEEEEGERGGGV